MSSVSCARSPRHPELCPVREEGHTRESHGAPSSAPRCPLLRLPYAAAPVERRVDCGTRLLACVLADQLRVIIEVVSVVERRDLRQGAGVERGDQLGAPDIRQQVVFEVEVLERLEVVFAEVR